MGSQETRGDDTQTSRGANGGEEGTCGRLHVLLVEDDALVRAATDGMLRRLGCLTLPCERAEKAVSAVLRNPGGYDLIVSDVDMPGMSGWQLLEAVHALATVHPIVVLSSGRPLTPPHGTRCSPDAVLPKPYGLQELHAVLSAARAARRRGQLKAAARAPGSPAAPPQGPPIYRPEEPLYEREEPGWSKRSKPAHTAREDGDRLLWWLDPLPSLD